MIFKPDVDEWQRAFVLHRRIYQESSLLLDCFTERQGVVRLLAKGARKRPQTRGSLQLFTPLLLRWSGRGTMKTLTQSEAISIALPLTGTALYSAFYVNELLYRTLEQETAYTPLFFEYLHCVQSLARSEEPDQSLLRNLELVLLEQLGYGVDFLHCAGSGRKIEEGMSYFFQEKKGFIASLLQGPKIFLGRDILALAHRKFPDVETLKAAKRFTRIALKPFLNGKRLKSADLFK